MSKFNDASTSALIFTKFKPSVQNQCCVEILIHLKEKENKLKSSSGYEHQKRTTKQNTQKMNTRSWLSFSFEFSIPNILPALKYIGYRADNSYK